MSLKNIGLIILITLSLTMFSKEGRLGKEPNDYSYANLGFALSYSEGDNLGLYASVPFPGPLYATVSRTAYDTNIRSLDNEEASFEKSVTDLRLGAHVGIGDLLNSVSVGSVSLNFDNFVDIYVEGGLRSFSFDTKFDNDESFGNIVAGVRYGDANHWEGKLYLDFSKEVLNGDAFVDYDCLENPTNDVCLTDDLVVQFSDDIDIKLGMDIVYNVNNYFGVVLNFKASEYQDSEFGLSLQLQL
tara:strand:- start:1246 stop:1974 length:729 start_codon:yes stop_codon:yes gene_type:complete